MHEGWACVFVALFGTVTVGLVACGAAEGVPEGFTSACEAGQVSTTKGISPARPVDFLGVRVESTSPRPVTGGNSPDNEAAWTAAFTGDVQGTLCGGASDPAKCRDEVAKLRLLGDTCQGLRIVPKVRPADEAAPSQPTGTCETSYLLYTRGDEVGTLRTPDQVRAFLGDIDSPADAMWLASQGGEALVCSGPSPASYAKIEGGYEITTASACGTRVVRVTRDGTVTVVKDPC